MIDNTLAPGVQTAGDVEFKRLDLIDTKNKNACYNLLGAFIDFTVYEDLFSPVLTGYIALVESQNLIEMLPIVGEEQIYAEFSTPSLGTIKCTFQVTKVGLREHGDKKNSYTLDLISSEGYIDLSNRFSKSYSGNTGTLMSSVYKSTFGNPLIDADISDNTIKFISPYWSPLKILNHITSKAIYPNNNIITPNYLFYQTCFGHKFKSLTTLLNQSPFMTYVFDKNPSRTRLSDGTSTRDINREYSEIQDLTFIASPDFIKNMINGAYNHNVYNVDLFNKSYSTKSYSISDDFSKTAHTDAFRLSTYVPPASSGLRTVRPTYTNLFDGITDISADIAAKRTSLLAQLETWKLGIVVPGRTDMSVGMVVNVMLNKFKTVDMTDTHSSDTTDKIYSGKYLITAIQHRFTMSKHSMNIELVKDAAFTAITVQ